LDIMLTRFSVGNSNNGEQTLIAFSVGAGVVVGTIVLANVGDDFSFISSVSVTSNIGVMTSTKGTLDAHPVKSRMKIVNRKAKNFILILYL